MLGYFRLMLHDNETGESIYDDIVWNFYRSNNFEICNAPPKVIASGNYLIACCTQGGRYGKEIRHELSNTLLCIKVDPESKTCKVRRTGTGWEMALLARAVSDENQICLKRNTMTDSYRVSINNAQISCGFFDFLGFAFESVVVCRVKFDYRGVRGKFKGAKAFFSIDLNKIMNMQEPGSVFSAVHFPLATNVLDTAEERHFPNDSAYFAQHKEPKFYPHYKIISVQRGNFRVQLAGVIEISSHDGHPVMGKLHHFRCLEAQDTLDKIINSVQSQNDITNANM